MSGLFFCNSELARSSSSSTHHDQPVTDLLMHDDFIT
jgi:hypothetical protein